MKHHTTVLSILLSFMVLSVLMAQQKSAPTPDTLIAAKDTSAVKTDTASLTINSLRKIPNAAFVSGEYLKFDVNYGFVTAGEAVMRVSDTTLYGRKCLRVDFSVDSKPFFNWIYKVEDRYSTIIDSDGMFPWRFEQHIREGGYRRDFLAEFDQINHVAKTTEGVHTIPAYVHDMMSAFYFARTIDYSNYRPGQKMHLQNFYKDSTYELDVKFKGRQTIEVDAGKFNCVIVEPLAKEGGLFKSDGRVLVWLTDDERKVPVKVSTQVPIGSIDSELVEYYGINGPLTAKVKEE